MFARIEHRQPDLGMRRRRNTHCNRLDIPVVEELAIVSMGAPDTGLLRRAPKRGGIDVGQRDYLDLGKMRQRRQMRPRRGLPASDDAKPKSISSALVRG